ncbi:MAG: DUF5056 domain-containing protein [Phocaeicola sp.]
MKDKQDQLIKQFMQSHKHEIANHGFSQKVANKLPKPLLHRSEIVHALCWVALFYLLILLDLFTILLNAIDNWLATTSFNLLSGENLLPAAVALLTFILIGVQKACSTR